MRLLTVDHILRAKKQKKARNQQKNTDFTKIAAIFVSFTHKKALFLWKKSQK